MKIELTPLVVSGTIFTLSLLSFVISQIVVSFQKTYPSSPNCFGKRVSVFLRIPAVVLMVASGLGLGVVGVSKYQVLRHECKQQEIKESMSPEWYELYVFFRDTRSTVNERVGMRDWDKKHPNRPKLSLDVLDELFREVNGGSHDTFRELFLKDIALDVSTLSWNQED